jgi:hypothetical protein
LARDIYQDDQRLIDFEVDRLPLAEMETELFGSVSWLSRWAFADHARRILMDLATHLSDEVSVPVDRRIASIDASTFRRLALIAAAAVTVRSASAGISLVAAGYTPEARGPARRVVEAKLHTKEVLGDPTGTAARRYTEGRAGKLTKLAAKYGETPDIDWLSRPTHADVRGLPLTPGTLPENDDVVGETEIAVHPSRDPQEANSALAWFGYECLFMGVQMAPEFGVKLNLEPWIQETIDELHGN